MPLPSDFHHLDEDDIDPAFDPTFAIRREVRRLRTPLDRDVDQHLANPGTFGLGSRLRQPGIDRRDHWIHEVREIDAELRDLINRRRALLQRITTAHRALTGTGHSIDETTGKELWHFNPPTIPLNDPPTTWRDPIDIVAGPDPAERSKYHPTDNVAPVRDGVPPATVAGRVLRGLLLEILNAIPSALTVDELHRLILAAGADVGPPASRTIPNALRTELAAGRVRRTSRGVYRATRHIGPDQAELAVVGNDRMSVLDE